MPKTLLNLCTEACPSPADDLAGFLAWHRSVFGGLRMEDGDGDAGGDDTGDSDDGKDGKGDGDKDDDGKPPAEPPALVEERTARKNAETILSELLPGKSKAEIRKALKAGTLDALRPAPPKNDKNSKDDKDDVDVEQIKRDATREATEKANARIVSAEVRALAAELFEDPADAPLYLDLTKYDVDDDGNVDQAEIKTDLKKLLETKKHLAKKGGRPKPDKTQGAKGDPSGEAMPGRRRMAAAYADSAK